jgi:hypothetical protein
VSSKLRLRRASVVGTADDPVSPIGARGVVRSDEGSVRAAAYLRGVPALRVCPSCGSDLVQPLRWQQRKNGELLVELRCPECHVVMQACHSPEEMEELDRRQSAGRDQIVAAYEASVTESMECLAQNLREALERDLVGPDDFAPRGGRRKGRLPRAA